MRKARPSLNKWMVLFRCAAALAAIAVETYFSSQWVVLNPTTVGFLYLITIMLIASFLGLIESLFASVAATLCFNFFFLPPVGTFSIDDPLNWIALLAFLITSLTGSELSERARRRNREAESRQAEIERLYEVSRAILLADLSRPRTEQLARDLARIYELPFVAVYDRTGDQLHRAGPEDFPGIVRSMKDTAMQGTLQRYEKQGMTEMAISFGGRTVGSLAMKGIELSDAALHALSNLVALAIERAHAHESLVRADAARQSEEFKSTLMDALAHEFKTPLTSIKAAVTAILSSSVQKPEEQHELIEAVADATERLSALVTQTIRLARIEANRMKLDKRAHSMKAAIQDALDQMKLLLEVRSVEVSIEDDMPPVPVDAELIDIALRQLIDNAVKYSPPASPISISARSENGLAVIRIRNSGEGISEQDKARIFDKFYRGANARGCVPGTGLGLSITREIALAHGGQVRVESLPGEGAEFILSLPMAKEGAHA